MTKLHLMGYCNKLQYPLGAAEIDSFYVEYYHEMRELMKYGLLSMNGQNGFGSEFASLLDSCGIFLKMNFTTPSRRFFSWTYSGKELLDFISKINISPTDALYNIIDTHIKLANLTLPINYKDTLSHQSVATNAIVGVLFGDEQLLRIIHVGDNIILVYKINENDITLRELESYASNDLFIENMASLLSEDPDVKELMKMLVLAHSNMTYRLINPNATDSVDLEFPYSVLKKHCSINSKILI